MFASAALLHALLLLLVRH